MVENKQPIPGVKSVMRFRLLSDQKTKDAFGVAWITEDAFESSNESEATKTKSGTYNAPGTAEVTGSATILNSKDTGLETLEDAHYSGKKVEFWFADVTEKTVSNKYDSRYLIGLVTEFSVSNPADGSSEVSLSFAFDGKPAKGKATLDLTELDNGSYGFVDTVKTGA